MINRLSPAPRPGKYSFPSPETTFLTVSYTHLDVYKRQELVGLGLAYPDILNVDGHLVISKDLANADRVTIVTYGGSGHEPAQAGFVGKGMLDIQAVGDIFAAPNGQLVFDAMKMADKGHGVLLLTLNYAGDQLAGKQAMKLAKMCIRDSRTGTSGY